MLQQNKLSLVVDLDQTVLHATVDSHVEAIMSDPSNPDYEHVCDIAKLTLIDGAFTYYIKFRPGLQSFLERLEKLYELHVYTMGSRSYASEIMRRIDPDGRFFGDRIISREDSGGPDNRKQLRRIFPSDDRTVLIIDDRADVWDYCRNLVQVPPFYFFIGTGDVNARPGMSQHVLPDVKIPTSVEYRATVSRFVREPDHALEDIFSVLEEAHSAFFRQYKSGSCDLPDVKEILDGLKHLVLGETAIVFSGLAPVQSRIEDSHLWRISEQYGAVCDIDIVPRTTHIVSYRCDTSKVICAVQRGLQVVTPDWLLQSIFSWERLPEDNFRPARLPTAVPKDTDIFAETTPVLGPIALDEYEQEIEAMLAEESSSDSDVAHIGEKRRLSEEGSDESDGFEDDEDAVSVSLSFDSEAFEDELSRALDT